MEATNPRAVIGDAIRNALRGFETGSLRDRGEQLLGILGYESERFEDDFNFGPDEFLEWADRETPDRQVANRPRELIRENWNHIEMVFQYTDEELARQADLFGGDRHVWEKSRAKSFLFLAVDLKDGDQPRHKLAAMTRAINRPLMMPAIVFFRYHRDDGSSALTLAVIHRRAHKRDTDRDVLDRATLIKDIRVADPHRAHLDILSELSLWSLAIEHRTFDALHRAWQGVLDTEALNRRFYRRLFEWFQYAVETCSFPDDGAGEGNAERHVIRMITRLLFIWFLKEKRLVPEEFFEEDFADEQLKDHRPDTTDYYRAVLQNLFFATLNTPIDRRAFSSQSQATHRDFTKFRYKRLIKDPNGFKERFDSVPFVNGGLFDCLDTFEHRHAPVPGRRIDAFTDTNQGKDLHVPACVFFDPDRGLFDLLRKYKFTVEENTPLDQEVALDPELLGKTFENLLAAYNPETREHARKNTGSYYTPRSVVDYMVQEALVEHLSQVVAPYDGKRYSLKNRLRHLFAIDQGEGTLSRRQREESNPGDDDHRIHADEIDLLIAAIDDLRIIDPACGSGAFPMGVLHKLVMALGKVDPHNERWKARQLTAVAGIEDPTARRDAVDAVERAFSPERAFGNFGRKLFLIQRVIHGVDIQPIATQIAKLRFFISLIIEQQTSEERDGNFGIDPLPNLETCFVAADSLRCLARPAQAVIRTNDVEDLEKELQSLRQEWFDARDRDHKWNVKRRDASLRRRLRAALIESQWDRSAAEAVADWDAYDQNALADWFDPEWMFGLTDGFDIVIGNPPYIQLQKNGGKLANRYQNDSYATFTRSGDIYVLFCERGVNLLRSGTGVLAYITSNSWLRAKYGKKLRCLFSEAHSPLRIVEMGKAVFENAIVDSSVLLARHGGRAEPLPATDLDRLPPKMSFPNLPDEVWGEVRPSGDAPWSIMSRTGWTVMDKMVDRGTPIRKWDVSIRRGVLTGLNAAFIIDDDTRGALIAEDPKSADIIKPVLRGRDIRRWRAHSKRWLIDTHNGYRDTARIDVAEYPAVKWYLDQFFERLEKRLDKGVTPYNLRSCAFYEEFARATLFWIELAEQGRFAYAAGAEFGEATTFVMTGESLKYLCAVLNSPVSTWFLERTAPTSGMGALRWKKVYVNEIPIPRLTPAEQQPFAAVTDRILKAVDTDPEADVATLEVELNRLVYDLYGLSAEEIRLIEGDST